MWRRVGGTYLPAEMAGRHTLLLLLVVICARGDVLAFSHSTTDEEDTEIVEAAAPGELEPSGSLPDPKSCLEGPIVAGMTNLCHASLLRYTFDQNTRTCNKFIYGGCFGSSNLFLTREDCEKVCEAIHTTDPTDEEE